MSPGTITPPTIPLEPDRTAPRPDAGLERPARLMEQTPSRAELAAPVTFLKRPARCGAQSYQTMAHGGGCCSIQFFQLRRSKGGCRVSRAVAIAHAGTANTGIERCAQLGAELKALGSRAFGGGLPGPSGYSIELGQLLGPGVHQRPQRGFEVRQRGPVRVLPLLLRQAHPRGHGARYWTGTSPSTRLYIAQVYIVKRVWSRSWSSS